MRTPYHAAINKISPPSLPRVVPLRKLFNRLDRRGHYGITWISGMAGSGKTTLVASYLAQKKYPCLWYTFDESDEDLASFFYYLGLAAKKGMPRRRVNLPLLTSEYLQNVNKFARRYFEELYSRLSRRFFLVFDDYQKISSSSPLHGILRDAISMIPSDIHVIVLSRRYPPSEFARILANSTMQRIGWTDLRLSLADSKRIAEIVSSRRLSGKVMEEIYSKTQGWAAGLILMAKGLPADDIAPQTLHSLTPDEIFSYFAGEIFGEMEEEVKDFLLKSSFLPRMTVSMAKSLTGCRDASGILNFAERNHLFMERYRPQELVYQFHPLFREFLLARAKETLSKEETERLQRRAAEILDTAGFHEDAVDLFAEAGEGMGLVQLIDRQARELIGQGRSRTLEQWIRKLPEDSFRKSPWMYYWLGVSRQHLSPGEARDHFRNAFHLFDAAGDRRGLYLAWSGIVGSTVFEWNDFTILYPWIEWMEKDLLKGAPFPSPEIEATVAVNMMSALMFCRPHHPDMLIWVDKALSLSRRCGDLRLRIEAADWAVTYYSWVGNFARAEIIKKETGRLMEAYRANPSGMLHWKWLDISTRIFYGLPPDESTLEEISEALGIVEKTGLQVWEHMFLLNGIFVALRLGDLQKAGEFLERLEPILGPTRYHGHGVFHHCAALYHLLVGDMNKALEHERTAVEITEETGYLFPAILCRYGLAQILIEREAFDEAALELGMAHALSLKTGSAIFEFMCVTGKAWLAIKQENDEEGLRHLREGFAIGREKGFQSAIWWWQPEMMAMLCSKALAKDIEVDYCRKLIADCDLRMKIPPYELDNWPWALKVHTFGHFAISINGSELQFSGKGHRRPLELLKALIARGGSGVDIEKMMDDLWPDAEGDMAHSAFSTNLNRLRRILTQREAIKLQDGRLTLNRHSCWVDTWAFEALLGEAEACWERGGKQEAVERYEKAITLYSGPFLGGEPVKHWMVPLRERLSMRYLKTLITLGKGLEEDGRYKKAVDFYERGLETDGLEETFYQGLMRCHEKLGRYADAAKAYRRCREMLAKGLAVSPSSKTEGIFERISGLKDTDD